MILIVPAAESGRGGGHLSRCVNLVKDLRLLGKNALLFLSAQTENISKLINLMEFKADWFFNNEELEIKKEELEFVVLDRFQTPLEEISHWKKIAPVVGIDEGGKYRDNFNFLIDILVPENLGKPRANITSPALMMKNITADRKGADTQRKENNSIKILISFGHEDSAGLGVKTVNKLLKMKNNSRFDITLIKGTLKISHSSFNIPQSVKTLDSIPDLANHLHEYDMVITHYGLTAYEAAFSGTKVLLAHPSKYHKKLAKAAGFMDINELNLILNIYAKPNLRYAHKPVQISKINQTNEKKITLSELVNSFTPMVNRKCSVCGGKLSENSLARLNDRTYRRCIKCGVINMDRINPAPIEYEKEYFFESYKKQYGKTYLEDFDSIKNTGKNRLKIISGILFHMDSSNRFSASDIKNKELPALLDIGCAYGPFLVAAKESGYFPAGIDPAEDAVRYVQENLAIPAFQGCFPNSKFQIPHSSLQIPHSTFLTTNSFDVITIWFVIEHFTDCVLALKEIKKLLKPNGVLAFSTPSFSGISGRKNLRNFLSASPADHFTIWSPRTAKKALVLARFKVKKIVIAGHHPERFPLLGKFANSNKSFIYKILLVISRLFKLGDTFEVYAENKLIKDQ